MRFDLDHDWQGNLSTPRAKVGERTKTHLLILLCLIWLCLGLIGHAPWKPLESHAISVIKNILAGGSWLMPIAASDSALQNPPLYYLTAAALAKLLSPILSMHDAARLSSGIWMLITLVMTGMTGRELWGKGFGRQAVLVLIGCLGLVLSAHTIMPAVSSFCGLTIAFYSFALAKRRPYRAAILLGIGSSIAFLSTGILPVLIILLTMLALPLFFAAWRNKSFVQMAIMAVLVALPPILGWCALCLHQSPDVFITWWQKELQQFSQLHHLYFAETLLWYAWPALPLTAWGAWRHRLQLLHKPRFQLILVFFIATFLMLGLAASDKEASALPFLIPLTAFAAGSIETLKRGAAGALNWFGLVLFGLMSFAIWLGWAAMMTGNPAKIKERLLFLSGLQQLNFNIVAITIATAVTLIWLLALFRSQRTNRASVTNWAIGLTCVWTLLMTLWLPLIDSARSYGDVFSSLRAALPQQFSCMTSSKLGAAQIDLLHYYADVKALKFENEQSLNCDLYLIQDEKGRDKVVATTDWRLIWQGKRLNERRESFRLYQHI